MREQAGKSTPWMMSVNMFQPHYPFYLSEEFLDRYVPANMPSPAYREGELDNKAPFRQADHECGANFPEKQPVGCFKSWWSEELAGSLCRLCWQAERLLASVHRDRSDQIIEREGPRFRPSYQLLD